MVTTRPSLRRIRQPDLLEPAGVLLTISPGSFRKTWDVRRWRGEYIEQMISDYQTVTDALAAQDRQIVRTIDDQSGLPRAFAQNRAVIETRPSGWSTSSRNSTRCWPTPPPHVGWPVDGTWEGGRG
ncbi:hypothetical protein GCM10010182_81790 [Actinomadura cremea]|nr:hypothetical protein GCM10010182_81790 [Actinomadura cremea]